MSDLAEKILAAIEAKEDTLRPLTAGPRTEAERDIARRCAADREILARHRLLPDHGRFSEDEAWECDEFCSRDEQGRHELVCATCRNYAGDHEEAPCGDLLALARGYGIQP